MNSKDDPAATATTTAAVSQSPLAASPLNASACAAATWGASARDIGRKRANMEPENQSRAYAELLWQARRLARRLTRLHMTLVRAEEEMDKITLDLRDILASLGATELPEARAAPRPRRSRRSASMAADQRREAERGTAFYSLKKHADGSAIATINFKDVPLSPTLAALLSVLAGDPVEAASPVGGHDHVCEARGERGGRIDGDHHLVGWKTPEHVILGLQKKLGRSMGRHALAQNVHRLRTALGLAGINPYLVQTSPRLGMRFALWRAATDDAGNGLPRDHAGNA